MHFIHKITYHKRRSIMVTLSVLELFSLIWRKKYLIALARSWPHSSIFFLEMLRSYLFHLFMKWRHFKNLREIIYLYLEILMFSPKIIMKKCWFPVFWFTIFEVEGLFFYLFVCQSVCPSEECNICTTQVFIDELLAWHDTS